MTEEKEKGEMMEKPMTTRSEALFMLGVGLTLIAFLGYVAYAFGGVPGCVCL